MVLLKLSGMIAWAEMIHRLWVNRKVKLQREQVWFPNGEYIYGSIIHDRKPS